MLWTNRQTSNDELLQEELSLMLGDRRERLSAADECAFGEEIQASIIELKKRLLDLDDVRNLVLERLRMFVASDVRAEVLFEVRLEDLVQKRALHQATKRLIAECDILPNKRSTRTKQQMVHSLQKLPLRLSLLLSCYVESTSENKKVEEAKQAFQLARNKLVEPNLRLVAKVVTRWRDAGVPLADLLQEGCTGLIRAAEKFDPGKGFRFSTYATCWIRQRVSSFHDRITQRSARNRIAAKLDSAGESEVALLEQQLRAREPMMSLSRRLAPESSRSFEDQLADPAPSTTELSNEHHEKASEVCSWLKLLGAREREIVSLRFGLSGQSPMSLREIGRVVGLSAQRVNQLLKDALQQIRKTCAEPALSSTKSVSSFRR